MNNTDRIAIAVLFCLLIGWSFYSRKQQPPPDAPVAASTNMVVEGEAVVSEGSAVPQAEQGAGQPVADVGSGGQVEKAEAPEVEETPVVEHVQPENVVTLENDVLTLAFSSWGGGITAAELREYPATMEKDSGPVVLDFGEQPALAYRGISGLSQGNDFELKRLSSVNGVEVSGQSGIDGISFSRVALLTNGYTLAVTDRFVNDGAEPITIPASQLNMGPMPHIESKASTRGISYLGVASLATPDERVAYWGKKIPKFFGVQGGGCSRQSMQGIPMSAREKIPGPVQWVAVKNKFFAQTLEPADGGTGAEIAARRDGESPRLMLKQVEASLEFPEVVLQPGDSFERSSRYYVGPKKYSELKALGNKQSHIMLRAWRGWGWWRSACFGLMWLLNGLKFITHSYGIAIILLTIMVKVVFWPLTHKGTENMKKMKAIQPEVTKLRDKYKDNPKKLQEKQMLLYRQHGVNPLAGCLPMVVQMPVFIALFSVLRSAVELRFASFLWIADLSEPEGLLRGVLPFPASGLNILPLAMTGTMILQQRLTPVAGDQQQQKMMQFMPLMMLFIFYKMASGLVLYWTISQLLSILQLVMQQRKDAVKS